MRHTTGEKKRIKTKSEELENLFGTLLLDLGSRIEDNEINIKFATNFKAKYKSRFEKIIENNVTLGSVSKGEADSLIAFSKWKEEKGYTPIYDHKGLVKEYLSNL